MEDLDFSEFEPVEAGSDGSVGVAAAPAAPSGPVVIPNAVAGARSIVLFAPPMVDGKRLLKITLRAVTQADIDDLAEKILPNRRALLCRQTGLHDDVIRALVWPDSRVLHEMFIDALPDFMKE